ncbi:MAG: hypothetical protein MK008_11010 [Bdellovibrionales bacterium]|nr:hypothetical protein [Bdellovibrionales bacterium]
MIKKYTQIALFVLMSVLDVKVRAANFSEQPQSCLENNNYPCAVKNISITQNLKVHSITLSPGSVVKWESKKHITLVKGSVLIKGQGIVLSSLYANVKVNGVGFVEFNNKMVEIECYKGEVDIDSQHFLIAGMKTFLPGFNEKGELIVEAPRPLFFEESVKKWENMSIPQLTKLEKKEFKNNVVEVVKASAEIYKSAIDRKIANHKQALLRQKQYRLKKQQEIQELNELFKKKNYLLE